MKLYKIKLIMSMFVLMILVWIPIFPLRPSDYEGRVAGVTGGDSRLKRETIRVKPRELLLEISFFNCDLRIPITIHEFLTTIFELIMESEWTGPAGSAWWSEE